MTLDIRVKDVFDQQKFKESFRVTGNCSNALNFCREKGYLPMTYDHPLLPVFNVLGLLTYFSGSLMSHNGGFQATIVTPMLKDDLDAEG